MNRDLLQIPLSEELAAPNVHSDLYIVPFVDYSLDMYDRNTYREIVRHNLRMVHEKYNSRTSLEEILSFVHR